MVTVELQMSAESGDTSAMDAAEAARAECYTVADIIVRNSMHAAAISHEVPADHDVNTQAGSVLKTSLVARPGTGIVACSACKQPR